MNEPKFKVGDEVRIIAEPPPNNTWEREHTIARYDWVSGMDAFCGHTSKIDQVQLGQTIPAYRFAIGTIPCGWNENWLEPIEKPFIDEWENEFEFEA